MNSTQYSDKLKGCYKMVVSLVSFYRPQNSIFSQSIYRSILWFPIPPLPDKTFWKFSDFLSENGLKSILTIIVMGNKQWFTSFCFQSWFPENEMLPDKTFWQRIQIFIICQWSTALWWCILLSTGLYSTIFNHKSRIRS